MRDCLGSESVAGHQLVQVADITRGAERDQHPVARREPPERRVEDSQVEPAWDCAEDIPATYGEPVHGDPVTSAFSVAATTATGLISTATTCAATDAARMAFTPLPVPMSSTLSVGFFSARPVSPQQVRAAGDRLHLRRHPEGQPEVAERLAVSARLSFGRPVSPLVPAPDDLGLLGRDRRPVVVRDRRFR